jgi:membrane protease YdiL (CAAX protease family)
VSTAEFRAFVAPARPRAEIWRTLAGTVLIAGLYALSLALALGAAVALAGRERTFAFAARLAEPATPAGTLALLATFLGMALAPMAVARLLHRRPVRSLFGRAPRVLRDFARAGIAVGALYAVAIALWSLVYDATPSLRPEMWLALLPLTVVGLLLQTGAEELVFRGYLLQQVAARFRGRLVALVVPAALFGIVHYAPQMTGPNAWIVVAGATLFGLFAADLTMATGNIGAAWGFHFVNNFVAIAVLATDGTITGLALYLTPYAVDAEGAARLAFLGDLAMLTLAWGLCRLAVRA